MNDAGLKQVAVADLIREAIDVYIEALEDEDYDGGSGMGVGADDSTE